jgi:hypothetical protein
MVKDRKLLAEFENQYTASEKLDYREALKVFEGMWREGVSLGVLPLKDPLEGIEVDIRIAKILNSV